MASLRSLHFLQQDLCLPCSQIAEPVALKFSGIESTTSLAKHVLQHVRPSLHARQPRQHQHAPSLTSAKLARRALPKVFAHGRAAAFLSDAHG